MQIRPTTCVMCIWCFSCHTWSKPVWNVHERSKQGENNAFFVWYVWCWSVEVLSALWSSLGVSCMSCYRLLWAQLRTCLLDCCCSVFAESCSCLFLVWCVWYCRRNSVEQGSQTRGPRGRFVRPGMFFGNFQMFNNYVAKCLEKRCREIN